MHEPVPPLKENATFQEINERFLTSSNNFLPVVDDTARFVGVVALHDSRSTPGNADLDSVRFTTDVVRQDPRFEVIDEVDSLTVLRRAASNGC